MKTLKIKVIPNAKSQGIEEGNILKIRVRAKAEDGKANMAVIELLSEHFHVKKSQIRIVRGHKSREKVIEIG